MSDADAIPVKSKPVKNHPDKVHLSRPSEVGEGFAASFKGWFNRYCLDYEPGGFVNCGEYQFYWHAEQNYVYGVCQTCGEVYVKPINRPGSRRTSDHTRYRGSISKRALAKATGGIF